MKDVLTGALVLVLVGSMWVQRAYKSPHTNLLPDATMVILAFLAVLLILLGLIRPKAVAETSEEEEEEALRWKDLARAVILLSAWVAAIPFLGFVVGGLIFCTAISLSMRTELPDPKGIALDLAVNAAVVFGLFLGFTKVLYVRLPPFGGF